MSLFQLILLTSLLAGSYCVSPECFRQMQAECEIKQPEMPKTTQDLRNFCSDLIPRLRCEQGVVEKCARNEDYPEDEEDVQKFRSTVEFVESSCNEDSQIFREISAHLECVTSTMAAMDDICFLGRLNATLRGRIMDATGMLCGAEAWEFHCINARFEVDCGKCVRDAVYEIQNHIDTPYCSQFRQDYSHFEAAIRSEFARGKRGGDALPGILDAIAEE